MKPLFAACTTVVGDAVESSRVGRTSGPHTAVATAGPSAVEEHRTVTLRPCASCKRTYSQTHFCENSDFKIYDFTAGSNKRQHSKRQCTLFYKQTITLAFFLYCRYSPRRVPAYSPEKENPVGLSLWSALATGDPRLWYPLVYRSKKILQTSTISSCH